VFRLAIWKQLHFHSFMNTAGSYYALEFSNGVTLIQRLETMRHSYRASIPV